MIYHCAQIIGFLVIFNMLLAIFIENQAALKANSLPPMPPPRGHIRVHIKGVVNDVKANMRYKPLHRTTIYPKGLRR